MIPQEKVREAIELLKQEPVCENYNADKEHAIRLLIEIATLYSEGKLKEVLSDDELKEMSNLYLCSVCGQAVDNTHNENDCLERVCEEVHKAYCQYCIDVKGKEYWTKGNYLLLDNKVKEADRYTVRAVLRFLHFAQKKALLKERG